MELSIQERLKDLRVERGLTLEQLEEQVNLSKSALGSYEAKDFKDISHYAIIKLAKFYGVTADYLLGLSQTRNHPNADLADLRLSDDMIELLKSGLIDNSLLCELAVHPDFPRLMADLEIYVNGIAGKQVQSANAIVDTMSATIMKQYNPGLSDPQLRQLIAAHIDDDSFCRYVIQQDINKIALDLRKAHKDDFFSVPEDNPLEDFLQTADEVASEDGDPEQASLAFICKRLKLNLKKLSEEEKKWLKKIAQKSDLLKNPNPQRGRKHVGTPTANIAIEKKDFLPKTGVYVADILLGDKRYYGVTHIGTRPTLDNDSFVSIETYIFDFDKDIYGCTITVNLYKKLREVRKFNELSLLLEQIANDRTMAQEFWGLKQTNHTLHIDVNRHCVILEQQEVYLSTNEFEVLYLLLQSPQTAFTKEQIYEQIWHEPTNNHLHAAENTIFQIRKRLKPYCMGHEYIKTVIGYGYKFNSE